MGISTHVLDTGLGLPAAGVEVTLEQLDANGWHGLTSSATDADGRCKSLLPEGVDAPRPGIYKVRFETGDYFKTDPFKAKGICGLYPFVEIVFEVSDARHYHIPLLLTANGYTTYRGS